MFRRVVAVALGLGLRLTFGCRCKISDQVWKPGISVGV